MKDQEIEKKDTAGIKFIIGGLALIFLPLAFAMGDAALGVSEGANIGAGLLFIFGAPIGLTLIIVGVLRIVALKPKR